MSGAAIVTFTLSTSAAMSNRPYFHPHHQVEYEKVLYRPYVPTLWKDYYVAPCSKEHIEACPNGTEDLKDKPRSSHP